MARRLPESEPPYDPPPAIGQDWPGDDPEKLHDGSFFGLEQDAVKHQRSVDHAEQFAKWSTNMLLGTVVLLFTLAMLVLGIKGILWLANL